MTYPQIYLMRHGQTEWNIIKKLQGQLDSALSIKGREQAIIMGKILSREIKNPKAYEHHVSPLGRTLETAELVAENFDFTPTKHPILMEVDVGSWSALYRKDIIKNNPQIFNHCLNDEIYFNSPDGESLNDVKRRAQDWLNSLTQPTIAVTHGQIGLIIRALYTNTPHQEAISKSERQDGVYLLSDAQETFLTL